MFDTTLTKLRLAADGLVDFHKPPKLRPPRPDLHRLRTLNDPDLDDNSTDDDLSMSDDDLSLAKRD